MLAAQRWYQRAPGGHAVLKCCGSLLDLFTTCWIAAHSNDSMQTTWLNEEM